jgi:hypothetical protein
MRLVAVFWLEQAARMHEWETGHVVCNCDPPKRRKRRRRKSQAMRNDRLADSPDALEILRVCVERLPPGASLDAVRSEFADCGFDHGVQEIAAVLGRDYDRETKSAKAALREARRERQQAAKAARERRRASGRGLR